MTLSLFFDSERCKAGGLGAMNAAVWPLMLRLASSRLAFSRACAGHVLMSLLLALGSFVDIAADCGMLLAVLHAARKLDSPHWIKVCRGMALHVPP